MPRLQCNQRQQKSTGTLKSLINEALAEEVRRGEQRMKRSDRATAAVPETESAPEPRENPIEPEANPKRRLLMKLASLTASGNGQ